MQRTRVAFTTRLRKLVVELLEVAEDYAGLVGWPVVVVDHDLISAEQSLQTTV